MMNFNIYFQLIIICLALAPLAEFLADFVVQIKSDNKIVRILVLLLTYILSCSKCFSFWFILLYTNDLFISASVSLGIVCLGYFFNYMKSYPEIKNILENDY